MGGIDDEDPEDIQVVACVIAPMGRVWMLRLAIVCPPGHFELLVSRMPERPVVNDVGPLKELVFELELGMTEASRPHFLFVASTRYRIGKCLFPASFCHSPTKPPGWVVNRTAPSAWVNSLLWNALCQAPIDVTETSSGARTVPRQTRPSSPATFQYGAVLSPVTASGRTFFSNALTYSSRPRTLKTSGG